MKGYLVDHVRLRHKKDDTGMFMCILGKCADKHQSFPEHHRMEKHKTTHVNVKCNDCEKSFSAKRNLRGHIKKKTSKSRRSPFRHGKEGRNSYPAMRTKRYKLVDGGFLPPNKVYLLAVYVNTTLPS